MCFRDGAIIGRTSLDQFGAPLDIIEEEVRPASLLCPLHDMLHGVPVQMSGATPTMTRNSTADPPPPHLPPRAQVTMYLKRLGVLSAAAAAAGKTSMRGGAGGRGGEFSSSGSEEEDSEVSSLTHSLVRH